jgi:hypothetical protein
MECMIIKLFNYFIATLLTPICIQRDDIIRIYAYSRKEFKGFVYVSNLLLLLFYFFYNIDHFYIITP